MKYANKDGSVVEWIWNSRDAITPFCIYTKDVPELAADADRKQLEEWRDKYMLRHVQWGCDTRMPDYVPCPGERVFVTLTKERAVAHRTKYVEAWWNVEGGQGEMIRNTYPSKEAAIERLASADLEMFPGETPDVISGAEYLALQGK